MAGVRRLVVPIVMICLAAVVLWPYVDRTASRVSLCVVGIGLVLAWYSILDLQEHRKERFWPHTVDRLMRATFTAVTLVLVVHLVVASRPVAPPAVAAEPAFGKALVDLVGTGRWNPSDLNEVITRHFGELRPMHLAGGFELRVGGQQFQFVVKNDVLTGTLVK